MVLKEELNDLLREIAEDLDIPGQMYEDAVLKYTDVGEWLAQEDSELSKFDPDIYPQGSFRLGTMVRPINDSEEYDIDLVCHLKIKKESTTQKELKERVGKRLEAREDLKNILKPSRRCWVLDYHEPFHMDVLPVIPNIEQPPNGILLTDTELHHWQFSNPIEYAEWFKDRMKVVLKKRQAVYAEKYAMSIEEVPEYEVKTPLQRAIQILKRHREIYFAQDPENRPVSIILTTLAAKAYNNQDNIYEALVSIATKMHEHIEKRENGDLWVANPVEENENFADKWNEYPERHMAFLRWLKRVRIDFESASNMALLKESADALSPNLGKNAVSRAASSLGIQQGSLVAKSASSGVLVPGLADASHCKSPNFRESLRSNATVKIKGSVYKTKSSGKELWKLTDRAVPKDISIKFVAETNVQPPYDVRWQVVNTGAEAIAAGCLRGGFDRHDDDVGNVRWETTAYAGTHWIEAFIIKDGVCIARSQPVFIKVRG
ncbi:nucleotide-binding domain-containing protein [Gimesia chilikensis]|uniref:nucleotide-binding domain-containing protein n=1 Tax=Gimesia chilikensis TaxID=2605989 RepID=UPI003A91967A